LINPPGGEVTFLFTDIEGSTKLAQNFAESLPHSLEIHHSILKGAIESNGGFVFEIIGDAFCAAFENAADAVLASQKAQLDLNSQKWKDAVIKVRMGIHRGNAEWNGKRYMGYITLARTQRVMSAAYGGQVLISVDAFNQLSGVEDKGISFRDLGERRLKDLIQPVKIFQLISKDLPSDFPPLNTLDARPNNLPVQLTSFIGRKSEIEKVKELLVNTRLITLSGPGGAGKTRLALQVAADVIDDFANGVWFVELAPLIDPLEIPQEILKELGIKEESKKSLDETLIANLREKEILIVLDNCEHLIEACAVLTERLLKSCPKLKIIATSREAMKCSGEQIHQVLSLETPNPKDELSAERLAQYESVRLFIERALIVNPKFRVNNENAPAIAGICSQLDGIPLAIELAAARIKTLSAEKIYERLNNSFSLLTGGKRTALPRQQTLRALIDWSYDLLTDNEKILWRRLSVFNDGWTLESAEEICPDIKINPEEVFDLLGALVEKSILIFDEENQRYGILQTLKRYGEEKLKESDDEKIMFSHHLFHYMELAETAEVSLEGPDAQTWLDRLEKENGNLESAIEWAVKNGEHEQAFRLTGSLGIFWDIRGYFSVGMRLFDNVLDSPGEVSKPVKAKTLSRAAAIALNLGDYRKALKLYEDSFSLYHELNDKAGIASSLRNMGIVSYEQGDYEKARKLLEEHLSLCTAGSDKKSTARTLNYLGNITYDQGDYLQARKYHERSLELREESGNKRGIASSLNNLGNVAYNLGEFESSQKLYEQSLEIKREIGDKKGISTSLHNLGILMSFKADYKQAQAFFEESLELERSIGDKTGIAETLYELGNVEYKQEDFKQAQKFYTESLRLRQDIGNKLGIVYCIMSLAYIEGVKGSSKQAARLLGFVDEALRSMNTVFEKAELMQYEQAVRILNEKLSDEEISMFREEGKKLTIEEAAGLLFNPAEPNLKY